MSIFINELYDLMKKYSIHKIYIAYRDYHGNENDFVENHQATSYNIQKYYTHIPNFILRFIERNFPFFYRERIVKNYTLAYKEDLYKLLKFYNIDYIKMTVVSLNSGVVRYNNKISIKNVTIRENGTLRKIKNKEYDITE